MADEDYVKFKERMHRIIYEASHDPDVNDVDLELFRMHLIDLQEDLDELIR